MYTLKINQLEMVFFIWVNELKFTQVELLPLVHFKSVVASESELFCVVL